MACDRAAQLLCKFAIMAFRVKRLANADLVGQVYHYDE